MTNLEDQVQELAKQLAATNRQIEKMAEGIILIARIDERSKNTTEMLNGFGQRLSVIEKSHNEQEVKVALNGNTSTRLSIWIDRIIMLFVGSVIGYVSFLFKSGG